MIDTIIQILKQKDIAGWILKQEQTKSEELFFVKDKLDQNRLCETNEYHVTVYVDFEEDGERYKGNAEALISAGDSPAEIEARLDQVIRSARFVKNRWYPLATNASQEVEKSEEVSNIAILKSQYDALHEAIFTDYGTKSKVNSVEIFAVDGTIRLVTSTGTDVTFPSNRFMFELVTDCPGNEESVEIFNDYTFGILDIDQIRSIVQEQLRNTEARGIAVKAPKLDNINIILRGAAVEELLQCYITQATDEAVYNRYSRAKRGERFNAPDALQSLNIRMEPNLTHAVSKAPLDRDGVILHPYTLYNDSVVENFRTTQQISSYMGEKNIGCPTPFVVEGSDTSYDDFLKEDYLEIVVFSSFISSPVEGDFGGEYRLAKLVQNGKATYITGGSISENLFEAQNRFIFSKENEHRQNSITPKAILIRKKD